MTLHYRFVGTHTSLKTVAATSFDGNTPVSESFTLPFRYLKGPDYSYFLSAMDGRITIVCYISSRYNGDG